MGNSQQIIKPKDDQTDKFSQISKNNISYNKMKQQDLQQIQSNSALTQNTCYIIEQQKNMINQSDNGQTSNGCDQDQDDLDEENINMSQQGNNLINSLKLQNYRQANIMQKYNQHDFSQNSSSNYNGLQKSIREFKLKISPQIPQKNQYSFKEIDANDENANPNTIYQNQNHICQKQDVNCSQNNVIPCEFCSKELINETNYTNNQQKIQRNNNNSNEILQQKNLIQSNNRNNLNISNNSNCEIECEICKSKVPFDKFLQHQEDCDNMLLCNNCQQPVPSRQLNAHLKDCMKDPWLIKSKQNNMKMCDYCRIFIIFDYEDEFQKHLNQHQKQKFKCNNCQKSIRYNFKFQKKFHQQKKCIETDVVKNKLSHQRILLLTQKEAELYNGHDSLQIQQYWDVLDRYIFEEKHGLQDDILKKVPNLQFKKSKLKQINSHLNNKNKLTQEEIQNMNCTICIDSIEEQQMITILPCSHIFHQECLIEWLKRDGVCAICRKNVVQMLKI